MTLQDVAGNSATATLSGVNPAGVAGSEINLALTDPSGGHIGTTTATFVDVPSGWTLSEGTDNGDGTWSVSD